MSTGEPKPCAQGRKGDKESLMGLEKQLGGKKPGKDQKRFERWVTQKIDRKGKVVQ